MNTKVNLLNFSRAQLGEFFVEHGEKPFRAQQIVQWVHKQGVTDFAEMTNLSKTLRTWLMEHTEICAPEIVTDQTSSDGTRKWLLRVDSGNCIEMVFIPQRDRGTLCVSSQVGCAVDCSFCATGKQGFNRNLSVAEIIGQVWLAVRLLSQENGAHDHSVTNVVMMGMGEPLLNFEPVVAAMDIMLDDLAYGLSKYRVTLSTSGIVPEMQRLAECSPVALAVSLHASTDELRNQLVPINKKYPLEKLMAICRRYYENEPRRYITFEYVMLDGVNDSEQQARELCGLLEGIPSKVNLIPFNTVPGITYKTSDSATIEKFQTILMRAGISTITRLTRGDDIAAACGQLVGEVQARGKHKRKIIPLVEEVAA